MFFLERSRAYQLITGGSPPSPGGADFAAGLSCTERDCDRVVGLLDRESVSMSFSSRFLSLLPLFVASQVPSQFRTMPKLCTRDLTDVLVLFGTRPSFDGGIERDLI